jgi:hypothetical protein
VDIEKWWSLQLVHFTGRELSDRWGAEESWQKLDEAIRSAVQVRVGTNELSMHAEVTLQTIIRDWPPTRQLSALEDKVRELQLLRPRLVPDLGSLVDEYCEIIAGYLRTVNHGESNLSFGKHAPARRTISETLVRLDELDARRALLRAAPALPVQADSRAAPSF